MPPSKRIYTDAPSNMISKQKTSNNFPLHSFLNREKLNKPIGSVYGTNIYTYIYMYIYIHLYLPLKKTTIHGSVTKNTVRPSFTKTEFHHQSRNWARQRHHICPPTKHGECYVCLFWFWFRIPEKNPIPPRERIHIPQKNGILSRWFSELPKVGYVSIPWRVSHRIHGTGIGTPTWKPIKLTKCR